MPRVLAILAVLLLAAAPARALVIWGGALPAVNERFSGGFPGAPVANTDPSFLAASLDLSGVGWLAASPQFALTLLSPRHFAIAAHTAPAPGATVTFLSAGGALRSYTVDSVTVLTHTGGQATDLAIGRLAAAIPAGDLVAHYPLLVLPTFADYLGRELLLFGQNGRVGTNTLDAFLVNADMLPFGAPNGLADSVLFRTDLDAVAGQAQGESGDSGAPTFHLFGGQLGLLGVHSAVDVGADPDLTYDSFLPSYFTQVNSLLAADGYALQAIPEPAAATGLLALAALAARLRRRPCSTRSGGRRPSSAAAGGGPRRRPGRSRPRRCRRAGAARTSPRA